MDGSGITTPYGENKEATTRSPRTPEPCGYVIAEGDAGVQFCDAPAERGSSYCARHRALCVVAPDTPQGRAIAAALVREAARPLIRRLPVEALEYEATEPEEVAADFEREPPDADEEGA
jgi:hypothetical protein